MNEYVHTILAVGVMYLGYLLGYRKAARTAEVDRLVLIKELLVTLKEMNLIADFTYNVIDEEEEEK